MGSCFFLILLDLIGVSVVDDPLKRIDCGPMDCVTFLRSLNGVHFTLAVTLAGHLEPLLVIVEVVVVACGEFLVLA